MGIFSQDKTTTNQTAYNQQVALSNRDLSGSQSTIGAGAVGNTNATTIINSSLDETALQASANTINHAIDANSTITGGALTGFQNALSVVAEHQQSAADLATGQQSSTLGQLGLGPQQVVYIVGAIVGGLILVAYLKNR